MRHFGATKCIADGKPAVWNAVENRLTGLSNVGVFLRVSGFTLRGVPERASSMPKSPGKRPYAAYLYNRPAPGLLSPWGPDTIFAPLAIMGRNARTAAIRGLTYQGINDD